MPAHVHDRDPPPTDPLARERAHLAASRAALRAMREDVEALDIRDVTANWVNAEVLQPRSTTASRRSPTSPTPRCSSAASTICTPPARELAEGAEGERFYIGRRHVHDADGDPMVIDWRAPVSQPFYRASKKDPHGRRAAPPLRLHRRRAHRVRGRAPLRPRRGGRTPASCSSRRSSARASARCATSSRPSSPSRTRSSASGLGGTVCVQGGPGTGKTAVGLHRVAYLLYAHRERLARTGTLVIGPNRSFLHYIEQVLPALGELEVKQATVDDLVRRTSRCAAPTTRPPPSSRATPGWPRCCAGPSARTSPCPPSRVVVVRGSRRWRVPAYELEEIVRELLDRDIRYGAAREALPQRIAHAVLVRMEQVGRGARRPGAGRGGPQRRGEGGRQGDLAARRPGQARAAAALRRGLPRRARGRASSTEDEQKTILWAKPAREREVGASGRPPTRC